MLVHVCERHYLKLFRRGKMLFLYHHGEEILKSPDSKAGAEVIKGLYNAIVNNHNQIGGYYYGNAGAN